MIIYGSKPQFDPNTGQQIADQKVIKEFRCDYCGEILSSEYSIPSYKFDYSGHDPCFGSGGGEFDFEQELIAELGEKDTDADFDEALYVTPYIFCSRFLCAETVDREWKPCELLLMNEVLFHNTNHRDQRKQSSQQFQPSSILYRIKKVPYLIDKIPFPESIAKPIL